MIQILRLDVFTKIISLTTRSISFVIFHYLMWQERGLKLHQYDRNESRRSVSMVGSHHPWIEPGRWSCRGVKGTAMEVFSKSFFPLERSFFTQILTWWNMGFMEWWLEFLVTCNDNFGRCDIRANGNSTFTHKTLSKFMANLTNAMVETKQHGIEEYDLTFSRYWCLIFGLSVLYLILICRTGRNSRFSTGFRIEAPFTKLHGFMDTLGLGKLLEKWKIQRQSLDEAQPKPSI